MARLVSIGNLFFHKRIYILIVLLFTQFLVCVSSFSRQEGTSASADTVLGPDSLLQQDSTSASADTSMTADSLSSPDSVGAPYASLYPNYVGFGVGEKLVFSIQYGIVAAGEATMEIRNIAVIDTAPAYHIISDARSNDVFSVFFKVRDRYESFMDTSRLVSLRYEKHLREGKYKKDDVVLFDHRRNLAHYQDKEVPIHPHTQDVLSALYYVRTLPLSVGASFAVANHTDGKNYPLVVKVIKRERVTVEAGTFDCLVVEPLLKTSGLFSQKGKLTIWLTDDKYKIPVLMKSKVVIGSISAVLKSYRLANKAD
jgi:hypothetical protein